MKPNGPVEEMSTAGHARSLLRRSFGRLAMAATVPLVTAACGGGSGGADMPGIGRLGSSRFSFSPDGREVVYAGGNKGIGLYDWRTGQVRYILSPDPDYTMTSGRLSPDGTKLVGIAFGRGESSDDRRLGVVDAATLALVTFRISEKSFTSPIFRPDGKAILYWAGRSDRPFLFDIRSQTSKALLPEGDGFDRVSSPSFVANDTIFFVGMGPRNPELKAEVQRLGYNPVAGSMPYLMKIGSRPELAYMDVLNRYSDDLPMLRSLMGGPSLMPASRNGERIAFIGLSQSTAARQSYRAGGLARYDLFVIEAGQLRQVTHLENFMSFTAISYDGSTAAFGIYPLPLSEEVRRLGRLKIPLELAIVDLNTGQVTKTDFARRVLSA